MEWKQSEFDSEAKSLQKQMKMNARTQKKKKFFPILSDHHDFWKLKQKEDEYSVCRNILKSSEFPSSMNRITNECEKGGERAREIGKIAL